MFSLVSRSGSILTKNSHVRRACWAATAKAATSRGELVGEAHAATGRRDARRAASSAPGAESSTFSAQESLPRLPVPDVGATLELYLQTVKPLVSAEAYAATAAVVQRFGASDAAERAQQVLLERAASMPNWLERWWDSLGYLGDRNPVAVNSNYYFWLEADGPRAAELPAATRGTDRAARLIVGMLAYKDRLEAGVLPVEASRDGPLCMSQHARVFSHVRVPGKDMDRIVNYCAAPPLPEELQHFATEYLDRSPRHVAVLAGGHAFRLDVTGADGKALSGAAIRDGLEAARTAAAQAGPAGRPGVAALTGWDRTSWAAAREKLRATPASAAALEAIESALFVVVLEDDVPKDEHAMAHSLLCGAGDDRWFDKHTFVVMPDGSIGGNFEHSMGDGTTLLSMIESAFADSLDTLEKHGGAAPGGDAPQAPELLKWDHGADVRSEIEAAFAANDRFFSSVQSHVSLFQDYGAAEIKRLGVSPDAYAQMAMQLAFHKQFGYNVATYESNSTRRFLHGRTETVRSVSLDSVAFCKEMDIPMVSTEHKLALQRAALRRAAGSHVNYMRVSKDGLGVDRHLLGLKLAIAEAGGELPDDADVFSDLSYSLTNTWRMSTSHLGGPALKLFGFGPVASNGFGLGYMTNPDSVHTAVTSFAGAEPEMDVQIYAEMLDVSLRHMQAVLIDEVR